MVPAFNEEKLLRKTINDIIDSAKSAGDIIIDIIIVDDGSSDKTGVIAEQLAKEYQFVRAIHNEKNLGVGESFKRVIKMDLQPKFIFIAGDNDSPKELIIDLFKNSDKADLVFAYYLNREERGKKRNIISLMYQMIYMISFNAFIMYISGPCIYPSALLKSFNIKSKRFTIPVELTVKSLRSGSSFIEIPGYMQTGAKGSSALRLKNLSEVILTYIKLLIEIHITSRSVFNKRPARVKYNYEIFIK